MILRILFFLLIPFFSFCQDCYILKYGKSKIQERFIKELKEFKTPYCNNYKEIELTGDAISDRQNLMEVKEGNLFCFTETSAKYCKNFKNLNVLGVFIPSEVEYSKYFNVLSFYPLWEKTFDLLNEFNLKKLVIIFSQEIAEKAMHISSKAKEKGIEIKPINIEKQIDVSLKLSKVLKDFDGIIIPIDKTYFDKDLIEMVVETAHRENKKVLAFLELFLDYGVDYVFEIELKEAIKEAFQILAKKQKKGLFEVSSFVIKKGGQK